MDKLLTISIAAYNVEKYIGQTLDSVLNNKICSESLKSRLEVLVINDGSTDQTATVAEHFAGKFPDIVRIINKENGGYGSVINTGIQEAEGKYFKPLDGDDWLDGEGLSYVLEYLENGDADIVITDFTKCYANGKSIRECINTAGMSEGKKYVFDEKIDNVPWISYHAIIFKTGILKENDIHIDENCFYTDTELKIYAVPFIRTMVYLKCNLYCYRLGMEQQSVSRKGRTMHILDEKKVADSLLEKYRDEMGELPSATKSYIARAIGGHCVWHYRSLLLCRPEKSNKEEIIAFDRQIRNVSAEIYGYMESISVLVWLMRKTNYKLYKLICFLRRHKRER